MTTWTHVYSDSRSGGSGSSGTTVDFSIPSYNLTLTGDVLVIQAAVHFDATSFAASTNLIFSNLPDGMVGTGMPHNGAQDHQEHNLWVGVIEESPPSDYEFFGSISTGTPNGNEWTIGFSVYRPSDLDPPLFYIEHQGGDSSPPAPSGRTADDMVVRGAVSRNITGAPDDHTLRYSEGTSGEGFKPLADGADITGETGADSGAQWPGASDLSWVYQKWTVMLFPDPDPDDDDDPDPTPAVVPPTNACELLIPYKNYGRHIGTDPDRAGREFTANLAAIERWLNYTRIGCMPCVEEGCM